MTDVFPDTTSTQDITHDSVAARAHGLATAEAPDFTLDAPATDTVTQIPDFSVDGPDGEVTKTNVTGDSAVSPMVSAIDFNFDAPAVAAEPAEFDPNNTMVLTPQNQDNAAPLDMDLDLGTTPVETSGTSPVAMELDPAFNLDLGNESTLLPGDDVAAAAVMPDIKLDDISLTLDDAPKLETSAPPGGGEAKDDHWYDVQTKFDLAKAYQEMGDKDGAREILQEVIKEGDAAQQAEAKQLLDSLG
jgi:pilus assembly protein FimV